MFVVWVMCSSSRYVVRWVSVRGSTVIELVRLVVELSAPLFCISSSCADRMLAMSSAVAFGMYMYTKKAFVVAESAE